MPLRSDLKARHTTTFRFRSAAMVRSAFLTLLVALAAFAWPASSALAQDAPGELQIKAALGIELPAWWSVERVEIQASVNDGDQVEPRWRQRFRADAAPAEELYARAPERETVGPFQVLIATKGIAETHRLYGIARSSLERGDWVTSLEMENSVDGLGLPRSLLGGLTVVAGSDKAAQTAALLVNARELANTTKEGLARATVDAEIVRQLAAEATEALQAVNRQRLDALRERYESERSALASAAEAELAAQEEENGRRLKALKSRLAEESAEIEAMAVAAEAERAELVAASRQRLDALSAQYEEQRAALAAAAEAERAALEEENRSRLEALTAILGTESAELEASVAAAEAERSRLVAESQTILDALRVQYEEERVALAVAGEAERVALEEENRSRLEALKKKLSKESEEVEANVAAAEAERSQLIVESQEILSSLKAKHERERAALSAAAETLLMASEVEAETEARQALAAAHEALIEERSREAKVAAEVAASDMAARTARFDALVEGLQSDAVARRYAAFDLALASGDETLTTTAFELALASGDKAMGARAFDLVLASDDKELKLRAFDLALASTDERLKRRAVDMAVASDDEKLKARAVAQLPRITQWVYRVEGFSSEYDYNSWAASVIGPPTDKPCKRGPTEEAWYPSGFDNGAEWIRVHFAKPVLFPQIVVHETGENHRSVGFVRQILLFDSEGNRTDYPVKDRLITCPDAAEFGLWQHPKPVSEIAVVIDTKHHESSREGIDAIALVGTPVE